MAILQQPIKVTRFQVAMVTRGVTSEDPPEFRILSFRRNVARGQTQPWSGVDLQSQAPVGQVLPIPVDPHAGAVKLEDPSLPNS